MSSLEVKQKKKIQNVHQTKGVCEKDAAVQLGLEHSGTPFPTTRSAIRSALGPVLVPKSQRRLCDSVCRKPPCFRVLVNQKETHA